MLPTRPSFEEIRKLLGDREGITARGDCIYLDGNTTEDADRVRQIAKLYPNAESHHRPSQSPAPCVEIAPFPAQHPPREKESMDPMITIQRPGGDLRITLEALEEIRQRLVASLRKMQPPADYAHLVAEAEKDARPMIIGNTAHIGAWQLINRDNRLLLERQQMPRAPLMLFYEAPLEWKDGQWQVLAINRKSVRGL